TAAKEKVGAHSVAKATNKLFKPHSRKERPIVANFSSKSLHCVLTICKKQLLYTAEIVVTEKAFVCKA
ncbi:unnamed protein product, partial [Heterotrigona itama]